MSLEKRLEQEIGWLKVVFTIFLATGIFLLAWAAQNYDKTTTILFVMCSMAVLGIIVITILINRYVFKCLDRLERL